MTSTANVNDKSHLADSVRSRRSAGSTDGVSSPKRPKPPRRGASESIVPDTTGMSANSVDTDSTSDAAIFGGASDLLTSKQEERRLALLRRLNQITQKKEMLHRRGPPSRNSSPVRDGPPSEARGGARETRSTRFANAKASTAHPNDIRTSPLSPLSDPMAVDMPNNTDPSVKDSSKRSPIDKLSLMMVDKKNEGKQHPKPLPRAPTSAALIAGSNVNTVKNAQLSYCLRTVKELMRLKDGYAFSRPIDRLWSRDQLPNYFDIIKEPMDMGTVRARLESGHYLVPDKSDATHSEAFFEKDKFARDMRLVFSNATTYNSKGDTFYEAATRLLEKFESKLAQMPTKLAEGNNKKKSRKRKKAGFSLPDRRNRDGNRRKRQALAKAKGESAGGVSTTSGTASAAPSTSVASVDTEKAAQETASSGSGNVPTTARKSMPKSKKSEKPKEEKSKERTGRKSVEDMSAAEIQTRLKLLQVRLDHPKMNGSSLYNALARVLYDIEFTYDEKLYLGQHVTELPAEKLSKVVALASKDQNSSVEVNNNEEVELDFESLGTKTLRDMQAIVNQALNARKGFVNRMPNGDVARIPRTELAEEAELLRRALGGKKLPNCDGGDKKTKDYLSSSDDSDSSSSDDDSSDDDSDSDSSADEDDAEDMKKRREENLAHQQAMQKASTPLQSPGAK